MSSGVFTGLKTAQVFERGQYFEAGIYDVRVVRCLTKQTQRSGLGFIAELEVIDSNNGNHQIGSKGSWFQSMKNQMTAFSAIKEFAYGVYGVDPRKDPAGAADIDQRIEQLMEDACGPMNTLQGRCVHLETFITKTREKGTDFTVHKWSKFDGAPPPPMVVAPPTHQQPVSAPAMLPPTPQAAPPPGAPPQPIWNGTMWVTPPPVVAAPPPPPPQPVWNGQTWVVPGAR